MKAIVRFAIAVLCLVCGLSFARPPECDPGPHGCDNKAKAPSSLVQIFPFQIADKKGVVHLSVDKSGHIKADGKAVGRISRDGRVVDPGGKIVAVLRESSILEDSSGTPLVRIFEDGTFDNGSGVPVRWTTDGHLQQGDSVLDAKLLPSNTRARRAASIVFFLSNFILSSKTEELTSSANKSMDMGNAGKLTGACYISSGAGNSCFSGLTEQGCYKAAANVGGTADWQESKKCSN